MLTVDFKDLDSIRYPQRYEFKEPVSVDIKVNVEQKRNNEKVLVVNKKRINLIGTQGLGINNKIVFLGEDLNLNRFSIGEDAIIWK